MKLWGSRRPLPFSWRPTRAIGMVAFLLVGASSVAVFVAIRWWRGWAPGDAAGLAFGWLAAALMMAEALYARRRRLKLPGLGTAQRWLQFHIYGGTLAALFVLIHTGFRWPHGTFGFLLLFLTVLTTLSGLFGVLAQKVVPLTVTRSLTIEVIYERIPQLVADLRADAERVMVGASDRLSRFYGSHVQPALAGPARSWSHLVDVGGGRERWLTDFDNLRTFMGDADRERLERLQTIVVSKLEMESHYTWQTVLRWWPVLHVPPALLLLALVVGHIAAVVRF